MRITRIQLKNWLNYRKLDTGELGDRVFIIGPNAAGKSNLLEEPELSLNEDIVRQLPKVIHRIQSQGKTSRQVFITTHSEALLSDRSIPPEEVLRLITTPNGTEIKGPDEQEKIMFASGMNAAEVLLPSVRPPGVAQLHLALPL